MTAEYVGEEIFLPFDRLLNNIAILITSKRTLLTRNTTWCLPAKEEKRKILVKTDKLKDFAECLII